MFGPLDNPKNQAAQARPPRPRDCGASARWCVAALVARHLSRSRSSSASSRRCRPFTTSLQRPSATSRRDTPDGAGPRLPGAAAAGSRPRRRQPPRAPQEARNDLRRHQLCAHRAAADPRSAMGCVVLLAETVRPAARSRAGLALAGASPAASPRWPRWSAQWGDAAHAADASSRACSSSTAWRCSSTAPSSSPRLLTLLLRGAASCASTASSSASSTRWCCSPPPA